MLFWMKPSVSSTNGCTVPEWENLATGRTQSQPPFQRRPNPPSRMATRGSPRKPPSPPRPSEPSPACLPTEARRQQKLHHNPIRHRHPISHPFVPNPHPQTLAQFRGHAAFFYVAKMEPKKSRGSPPTPEHQRKKKN